jgi:formylglycine-generating enzyme required for sulfatase activity
MGSTQKVILSLGLAVFVASEPSIALGQQAMKAAVPTLAEEMAVISSGHFSMGSSEEESSREHDPRAKAELPVHDVTVRSFALAKHDVTRAEFGRFVSETGYDATGGCYLFDGETFGMDASKDWRNPGFKQSDRDPVVCVNWDDAHAYISWLSGKTGHPYRLPSEAEWEYAARAGTTTARFWGDDAGKQCSYANGADQSTKAQFPSWHVADCTDGYAFTAPVGTFQPNSWGLYDMLGNVWQWTEDCWNDSYTGAPSDGSVWLSGDCVKRIARGGSWHFPPPVLRAAFRGTVVSGLRRYDFGFRLAETLP